MKLWVAFFAAALCALSLPDIGDAGHLHLKNQLIAKRGEASHRFNVEFTTIITLMRKYPNEHMYRILAGIENIALSLSVEELESDHLEAIIIGKYGDGSYTQDDKEFFAALLGLLEEHNLMSFEKKMAAKFPGEKDKLGNAARKIFPALTVKELKSSNNLQIIEDKFDAFMN